MSPTLDKKNLTKLQKLKNRHVLAVVKKYINLCQPHKVTVLTGSAKDLAYVRKLALENGEEHPLSTPGHTVHFDGYFDQGRDTQQTKVLLKKGQKLGDHINCGKRKVCLKEIFSLLSGAMIGKEMFVLFYCLGPQRSRFSIPALQLTDSSYVAHSENILYRPGYNEFKRLKGGNKFFHFIHSAGILKNGVSKNYPLKRIYIDINADRIFSVNTQYAGNSVGLKKLALRLAIKKAHRESWLCEHMFLMGATPSGKKRVTYFTGAFPSACGKTSTAMISDQTILGDDIVYIRPGKDGKAYAVNVEQGIFGIIENVNPLDDPSIYQALTTPREIIFSNVLIHKKNPYWLGMGKQLPAKGKNFSGRWREGKKDISDNPILPAHRNARYTISIKELKNADPHLNHPAGVPVMGIIYGGRDSDTSPPVVQSFDWPHGVLISSCLESETTAATLGQTGVRKFNPMANLDFLTIPLGQYIQSHLDFARRLKKCPLVFQTNYFLKENGVYLNQKTDKKVWLLWMEGRIHNDFKAEITPIGFLPRYEDLTCLFKTVYQRKYTKNEYQKQFSIRYANLLAKLKRIKTLLRKEDRIPAEIFKQITAQQQRLLATQQKFHSDIISPFCFR